MKKLFTILCAFLVVNCLSAQTDAGTMMLEGSTNFNYSSVKMTGASYDGEDATDEELKFLLGEDWDEATNTMALKIMGGYFIIDGLAGGLLIDYSSTSQGDFTNSSTTIGPAVRYYIGESGAYGGVHYLMGSSKTKNGSDSTDGDKISRIGFGGGYNIYLNDYVALTPAITYEMITSTDADDDKVKMKYGGFSISAGLSIFLGN